MVRWKQTLIVAATVATLATPFAQASEPSLDDEGFDAAAWVAEVDFALAAAGQQPTAAGASSGDCMDQRDEGAVTLLDRYHVKAAQEYDGTITLTLYGESNDLPGLQTWWTLCDPEGPSIPPDAYITSVSTDRGIIW